MQKLPTVPELRKMVTEANRRGYNNHRISVETGLHYNTVRYIHKGNNAPAADTYVTLVEYLWSRGIEAQSITDHQESER